VHRRLEGLRDGEITLVEGQVERHFGSRTAALPLAARVTVRHASFYAGLALRGSLGAGEAWMDGAWDCDDLPALIRILLHPGGPMHGMDRGVTRLARAGTWLRHRLRRNHRRGSRRNIAEHYDLGNDFFAQFLDPTLTYSAAIFERPDASLEEASIAKYERICRKLGLDSRHHVLEIGSGWGGFAIHAARTRGCRVTTATVSAEQARLARERVAEAGVADRVEVRLEDYRDLRGRYDRLASIEMIEAVGGEFLDTFLRVCCERLAPDGSMLLQCIATADQRWKASRNDVDFIKRYVFPGGQLVALSALLESAARATDFRLEHLEDLSPHYAETLRRWRARFHGNREAIRALGHDERFLRLWDFYLAGCEGAFEERYVRSAQLLLSRPRARRPSLLGAL
jgi:cyclopropane-fatty-acyl-phospholipid synthase